MAQDENRMRTQEFLKDLFENLNSHLDVLMIKRYFHVIYYLLRMQVTYHPYGGELGMNQISLESFEQELVVVDLLLQDRGEVTVVEYQGGSEARWLA